MEVGEYVRTKYGIAKINKIDLNVNACEINKQLNDFYFVLNENIIKSSPNIIDLIEVGDYVNGRYVLDFETLQTKEPAIIVDGLVTYGWGQGVIPVNEIKSVVTKEQFENMEYKVEVSK